MAQECGFFNANQIGEDEYDRVYLAEQFAAYFASFIGNGVFGESMQKLEVLAQTEANMSVQVLPGEAWINGWWYRNNMPYTLNLDVADGTLSRIDSIVVRWGNQERDIWLQVIKGTPASNPVAPAILRNADYYDLQLATVSVTNGSVNITQSKITDTRLDNAVCGLVTGVVDQIDTTDLYNQFTAYFTEFKADNEVDFDDWTQEQREEYLLFASGMQEAYEAWFENIKDQLTEDAAGSLQLQIGDLTLLQTEVKSSLVSAINELTGKFDDYGTDLSYNNEQGKLSLLNAAGEVLSTVDIYGGSGISLGQPTNVVLTNLDEGVSIAWKDPDDVVVSGSTLATWKGTVVVRKAGSAPVNKNDGTIVIDSRTKNQYNGSPFVDSNLVNGQTYYYGIFPYTDTYVYNNSFVEDITPAPIYPPAVTNVAITAGDKKLTVTFSKDSSITNVKCVYKTGSAPVTSSDGTVIDNFTSGSEITGLTNGVNYYLRLYSYNAKGREMQSSAYSETPFGVKIVTWADGTDEEIAAMLDAHYAGQINIYDYWSVGDERLMFIDAVGGMIYETVNNKSVPMQASQAKTFVLMAKNIKNLVTPINGHTKCAFVVGMKEVLSTPASLGYVSSYVSIYEWRSCPFRTWCSERFYAQAFASKPIFKSIFKKVYNSSSAWNFNTSTHKYTVAAGVNVADYFAPASSAEILGPPEVSPNDNDIVEWAGNDVQFDYYKVSSNRTKKTYTGSGAVYYYTRSGWYHSTYYALEINTSGGSGNSSVTSQGNVYVPLFGCI